MKKTFNPPTEDVLRMRSSNMSNEDIARNLQKKKFGFDEINEAMNQANIKENVDGPAGDEFGQFENDSQEEFENESPDGLHPSMLTPEEAPSPSGDEEAFSPQPRSRTETIAYPQRSLPRAPHEQIEEITEAIVAEKWEELTSQIGDIVMWKETVNNEVTSVKQEILRLEERFENLQKAVLEEVKGYNRNIKGIGSEMRALEQVLQKIIQPLTTNIKELSRITKDLKGKKK